MRATLLMIALGSIGLAGCQSVGSSGAPPVTGSTTPAGAATSGVAPAPPGIPAPAIPTGAALGGVLGGPVGASLSDDDRQAAWDAQVAALDSNQKRSWRGAHGVFGFIEPGAAIGRRLPSLFADNLCRRPAEPRPRVGVQTAGRNLEDDELSFDDTRVAFAKSAAASPSQLRRVTSPLY